MQTELNEGIRARLLSIRSLNTQPAVIAKITQMLQNPATNAEELGDVIRGDPALAATVLRLVNSAFYGLPGRVASISHAIVLLGFFTVKNIVLAASMLDMFKTEADGAKFNAQDFWKHSLACGVVAQSLAQAIGYEQREECFVAGLIHDIGKVVMLQMLPAEFMRVVDCADKTRSLFYDSECKLLGISHQEIGGMLVEQWSLPPQIFSAVSCHHTPMQVTGDGAKLTAIVHCADIFARGLGYGSSGDRKIPVVNDAAWDSLALDGIDLLRLFDNIDSEWQKASACFMPTQAYPPKEP